ncbi:uncharacterized protein LOC133385911 isoform X1 [Rhineura floridana]|uniref:uncharacterized protein LOC133385911 isoform X1 n=1 Tax=Rhineura floridana TaxID=261503 RepID=UPI002AC7FF8B|nr:uncharacterized protein LOC133385911 isoform X1 [Rhineura floridana]
MKQNLSNLFEEAPGPSFHNVSKLKRKISTTPSRISNNDNRVQEIEVAGPSLKKTKKTHHIEGLQTSDGIVYNKPSPTAEVTDIEIQAVPDPEPIQRRCDSPLQSSQGSLKLWIPTQGPEEQDLHNCVEQCRLVSNTYEAIENMVKKAKNMFKKASMMMMNAKQYQTSANQFCRGGCIDSPAMTTLLKEIKKTTTTVSLQC